MSYELTEIASILYSAKVYYEMLKKLDTSIESRRSNVIKDKDHMYALLIIRTEDDLISAKADFEGDIKRLYEKIEK